MVDGRLPACHYDVVICNEATALCDRYLHAVIFNRPPVRSKSLMKSLQKTSQWRMEGVTVKFPPGLTLDIYYCILLYLSPFNYTSFSAIKL